MHVGRVIQGFLETVANMLVAEVDDPVVEIFWTSCGQVHLRECTFKQINVRNYWDGKKINCRRFVSPGRNDV